MIYPLNDKTLSQIDQIGGKAQSLMKLNQAGFLVPAGFVMTVDFFNPWLAIVKGSRVFKDAIDHPAESTSKLVKEFAKNLKFDQSQKLAFNKALESISGDFFAVRSSSPQEDLKGNSFAGIYDTFLGVKRETLERYVIETFCSLFNYPVLHYKHKIGIDLNTTSLAIIVQAQIDSDVSGVGFSLNPINNDYDEVVINSNFGLGESVVSGLVSPDQFVVDHLAGRIKEKILGDHELVLKLNVNGGIYTEKTDDKNYSLSDLQVMKVAEEIKEIETFYGFPVDIEWTFKNDQLYILQARPITAYLELEKEMMTSPGENRMLYMDINLVDALTSNVPILPLTMDWFYDAFMMFAGPLFGEAKVNGHLPPKKSLFFSGNGRVYVNLSQILHLTKLEKVMAAGAQADQQLLKIAKNIDDHNYRIKTPLPYLKIGFLLRKAPKWFWKARKLIGKSLKAYFWPDQFYKNEFKPKIGETIKKLKSDAYNGIPLAQITTVIDKDIDNVLFTYGFAAIIPLMVALDRIPKLLKDGTAEMDELADAIVLGTADNESIELGIALFTMAKTLKKSDFDDLDRLAARINKRTLGDEFLEHWDKFIQTNKYRGPNELELSNSRYGDNPILALQQMSYMVDSDYNPIESQRKNIKKREQAYREICGKLKGRKLKKFKINYQVAALYATVRDTPKYLWLLENGIVRERALHEGAELMKAGQIDEKEDIFYLYYQEIEKIQNGEEIRPRKIIEKRKNLYKQLSRIDAYPLFIDSRGFIPTAKAHQVTTGTYKGHGISRGVRSGRIKVMKNPTEKPIEKGDVMVTYTTDPGWTPLFVNVEAIILQVGGPLQHGGVVAREYGKPCVAGILNVYEKFHDGQLVEVDGTNGIVRLIEESFTKNKP